MKRLLIILLVLFTVGSVDAQRKKSSSKKKAKHLSVKKSSKKRRHHRGGGSSSYAEPDPEPEEEFQYVTMGADKRMVFNDPPEGEQKPYVLINDVPYEGNLRDINVNDVLEVSVVKRKSARAMYGAKAAAGAVFIKARHMPNGMASAPVKPVTTLPVKKSFIYNEEVTFGSVSDIAPEKILAIDTLIQPKFVGSKDNDTTLNVTSKVYGKKLYQYKFGTMSKAYKRYIRSRRGKDDGVNYVVSDGTTLIGGNEDDLLTLFKLYSADISSVSFTPAKGTRKNRIPATLNIELNQVPAP
ncbi:hypothetical protein INP83_19385 [Mucilaginibacter sp. 21P]|uniref:hypothetical protein n=1 Tax=Mucilaginibacter sp. 21P TaxID=2778902 RepID=UPI001C5A3B32|nr:hypothetical protein [Mucilaginibacter sp. 21P]QXV65215.1 hypothetical protein INP83_19385 [Mucilaginibacter sp. 21P]